MPISLFRYSSKSKNPTKISKKIKNNLFFSFVVDREASDWEAKFYQIQSKYLLLLNELHNPQVGVSASRQEMVGQLLKDIVEAERPNLSAASASFDRFGFRIETGIGGGVAENGDGGSLEDKAERLRKQAEDQSDQLTNEVSLCFFMIS